MMKSNIYGPITRYGLLSDADNGPSIAMSNLLAEGYLIGHAGLEYDGILLLSSASGSLKMRTLADIGIPTTKLSRNHIP